MATRDIVETARRLRREMTPPEARLWLALRGNRLGVKFRRQHPIGRYVLDFYCAELKLAVEVDGRGHEHPDQMRQDRARTGWLATQGVQVVRLAAEDVRTELEGVMGYLRRVCEERSPRRRPSTILRQGSGWSPSPSLRDGEETEKGASFSTDFQARRAISRPSQPRYLD
ncbi:MAG: endonuclease domain-containing protein [Brevundimonas sp.]|nr:endonuclease domain-containing protein [Brevundimonas sp.]